MSAATAARSTVQSWLVYVIRSGTANPYQGPSSTSRHQASVSARECGSMVGRVMERSIGEEGTLPLSRCHEGTERVLAMKLGVVFGYWGAGPRPGFVEEAQAAERLGYDSVWVAESWGNDAFTYAA